MTVSNFFQCLLKACFAIFLMSISIDVMKRIRYMMCGGISAIGTFSGKAKNVGRSTVHVGMIRIKLELWG